MKHADLEILLQKICREGIAVLLESQSQDHPAGRISYLAAEPVAIIKARAEKVVISENGKKRVWCNNPWDALRDFYQEQSDWLFGYLGYDLKNNIEQLASENYDPVQAPDLFFMVPGLLLKIYHDTGTIDILKGNLPAGTFNNDEQDSYRLGPLQYSVKEDEYLECIREAKHRIAEGEFYEINLSHQLSADFEGSPLELYMRMKDIGPVPFGAFLNLGELSICSMSPERFLAKQGKRIFSQPIKGTTKRGSDELSDKKLRNELQASLKNRAENLMIVDLVRNDLSRVASKGSVKVSDLFEIQTFGTVHQMVSTVAAESKTEDPIEIIKACYPMGSMTGAPKISAMNSIEELENYRRGIYSGAIGYLAPNGDFDFNVVIRTAIIKNGKLYYPVGGAITGDSDPNEEWEETLVKARALTNVKTVNNVSD